MKERLIVCFVGIGHLLQGLATLVTLGSCQYVIYDWFLLKGLEMEDRI